MGSYDVPPPHIASHVVPTSNFLLQIGGIFWTICYILSVRESLRSKSYGMPLFALALNFGWELVYALYVVESTLERVVFTTWLVIDCGLIYGVVAYAEHEWRHAPWVARNIKSVLAVLIGIAALGHWTFAKWWLDNNIGKKEGKIHRGVVGPDTTELGFWSAAFCQVYCSATSLVQLLVRQHSGGVSWGIWATRMIGTVSGLYLNYAWIWWFWTEAHDYVESPFALFLLAASVVSDVLYPFVLWHVRQNERLLKDGRKEAGQSSIRAKIQ